MAALLDSGGTGGLSEYVVVPLQHVHKLPSLGPGGSVPAAFANVGRNYFAAYHSLVEVGGVDPSPNNTNKNAFTIVLITGASGGVGMATIELAKAMGCLVIAGVGSPSKKEGPESVGADAVFSYGRTKPQRKSFRKEVLGACSKLRLTRPASTPTLPFPTHGVDLIVDVVMGDLFDDALVGCLKPLGTIALVGFAAGQKKIRPGILLVKEARVAGSIWSRIAFDPPRYRAMVECIVGHLASGRIRGRVDTVVPLSRFIGAFEVFEENRGKGNTVVSFVDEGANQRSRL